MKHSRWLTGVAAVLAVSMQTASQSLSERVEQKIEQHLGDIPSAAYAVVDADDLLASGAVNRPGKNATKHTRFRIGSLTKSFTAVCVLMLQDEGLLSVDDDVTEHLPDYPALEGLTIHDLLIHRSGLLNFTEIQQPPTLWTPEDVLGFVMTRPNWRTPDTSWRYCNTNYIILGLIVERVSGEDYGDFLKERVFDRLGMDRTRFWASEQQLAVAFAAGGIESSARDMGRYVQAMLLDEVDGVSVADLFQSYSPNAFGGEEGYGWRRSDSPLGPKISHNGSIAEGSSAMAIYTSSAGSYGIVLLANSQQTSQIEQFLDEIAAIVLEDLGAVVGDDPEAADLLAWIKRIQDGEAFEGDMTREVRAAFESQPHVLNKVVQMGPVHKAEHINTETTLDGSQSISTGSCSEPGSSIHGRSASTSTTRSSTCGFIDHVGSVTKRLGSFESCRRRVRMAKRVAGRTALARHVTMYFIFKLILLIDRLPTTFRPHLWAARVYAIATQRLDMTIEQYDGHTRAISIPTG